MKKCLSTLYYADDGISFLNLGFENDVNMYGTQAVQYDKGAKVCLRMM